MEPTFNFCSEKINNSALPSKDTIGHLETKLKINSFTEFAPIKGVILGYMGDTAQIPEDDPLLIDFYGDYKGKKYPAKLIKRCQEAQNFIAKKLINMGIEVIRPAEIDHSKHYELEGKLIKGGMHTFSPRDILFYFHDSVYECPTIQSTRVHETESMNWFLDQQRSNGGKWYKSYKMYYGKNKPLFDAANLMKIGFDITFLISGSGNIEGYEMFRNFMQKRYGNKIRIHPLVNLYDGFHLDVTFMPMGFNKILGKNLVLVNGTHCNPTNLPALFRGKNWVCLEVELQHVIDNGYEPGFNFTSIWLAQNILMMSPELVMIDENQKPLMEMFKFYGIESLAIPLEMMGSTLGGCHCMTNDYNREEDRDWAGILEKKDDEISLEERAGYFDKELLVELEKYDIKEWVRVCNEKKIFPTYATLHLNEDGKNKMKERHDKYIAKLSYIV